MDQIASVHYWRLKRPKGLIFKRTICCLLCGIIFPFLLVLQTTMFWCYCAEWGISNEGLSRLVSNVRISQYGTFLLDLLYPIFPRSQPDPAIEAVINTGLRNLLDSKSRDDKSQYKIDWFFRQTIMQKIGRIIIAFNAVLFPTFLAYNFVYWFTIEDEEENDISKVESIGGTIWFIILWLMMGSWYGHIVDVKPDVDAMFADEDRRIFRLHYRDTSGLTSTKNPLIHTNVEVFLKSYAFYNEGKLRQQTLIPKIILFNFFVAGIYSIIPGLHRIIFDNAPFLSNDNPLVAMRAMVSNFVLTLLAQYVFL